MRRSLALALLVATPLLAQEKKIGQVTLFGEEQLKVEAATKTEIPISKAPGAVTVITAKQIQETGARTIADVLRLVAGVNVRWNPMMPTIDIRGFGENPFSSRILLLIDGTHKDFQIEAYRHDDRMNGFAEVFPPQLGLPPTAGFRSAHDVKQSMDSVSIKYNHAPQGAPLTYSADFGYEHRYGMHCAGCHAAQEHPEYNGPENHGYQAIGDFNLGLHMIPGHDVLLALEARRLARADPKHELASFPQS